MQESKLLEKILSIGRKIIPKRIFMGAQPIYHYKLALLGALIYRLPARKLTVIGVTGTKGKSTTTEILNAILEADGKRTALANTIRYKVGEKEWRNMFKMTLRGRFFTQRFLRQAVDSGCSHAIIEMSSEGVPQFRHKFLFLDALIFTNLAPEHIEAHGSYENYLKAKLSIAKELEGDQKKSSCSKSPWISLHAKEGSTRFFSKHFSLEFKKRNPVIIANIDDKKGEKFLALNIKNKISYSIHDAINIKTDEKGSSFQIEKAVIHSRLPGIFNVYNMLGAIAYAKFSGISFEIIKKGLEQMSFIRGRMEKINMLKFIPTDKQFDIVVDYAHTPDSLRAIYETYKSYKKICVFGNTGGGRDKWKREEMGKIADQYCHQIILTNEDPYDEDPMKIVEDIEKGITDKQVDVIMNRRVAIASAIAKAVAAKMSHDKVAVLITGKGTDPYIMGPNGTKIEWDDAAVTREELNRLNKS